MLTIKNLHVYIDNKEIIKGLTLTLKPGEIHAIMGPNGSGKSTLAQALIGNPVYKFKNQKSKIKINKEDILNIGPDERAKKGLFLAFQNPLMIPGVKVSHYLRTICQNFHKINSLLQFYKDLEDKALSLKMDKSLLSRSINDGFSGGEKKKLELLQLLVLQPKYVIIDEIDTGLDVDALKIVAMALDSYAKSKIHPVILLISHYQRIFNYLRPDHVHIMINGKIVKTGNQSLITKVEKEGYAGFSN